MKQDNIIFRIPMFTDKDSFDGFQFIYLGDEVETTLCGYNGEPEQYSGKKDCRGKKIFDNDIVTVSGTNGMIWYYLVKYDKKKYKWVLLYPNGKYSRDFSKEFAQPYRSLYKEGYRVVGNIHENKNLLDKDNIGVY